MDSDGDIDSAPASTDANAGDAIALGMTSASAPFWLAHGETCSRFFYYPEILVVSSHFASIWDAF